MKLFSPSRNQRLLVLLVGLGTLTVASALVLNAFNRNLVFFFSPSQVHAREAPHERHFRLGGLVADGSVRRDTASLQVDFVVTDGARSVPVRYSGLLPDLFREGQGVVAEGKIDSTGVFVASEIVAKPVRLVVTPLGGNMGEPRPPVLTVLAA